MCAQDRAHHLTPSRTPQGRARAREQVARAGGLRVTGFMAKHAEYDGVYTHSQADPYGNGFPHYVSTKGWHLYVLANGKWGFYDFDPATSECFASTAGGDAVPTGETTWRYGDGRVWVDHALTVTELSVDEAAVAEVQAKEAVGMRTRPQASSLLYTSKRGSHIAARSC